MEPNLFKLPSKISTMKKLLLTAFLIGNSIFISYAGPVRPGDKNKEVAVTSLGVSEGKVKFNLKCQNADGDKFYVELMDTEGNKLYKEMFTDKHFNKTFVASSDLGKIFLIVTNVKDKSRHKFEISTEERIVQEVSIISTF